MESERSPSRSTVTHHNGGNAFTEYSTMTVRDYFAAMALQGIVSRAYKNPNQTSDFEAQYAYESADAMLREREKQK